MPRTLAFVSTLLLAAFCALPAQADSFIMRLLNKPVPGGVAVVDLGEEGPPPRAFYQASRCWWCARKAAAGSPWSASR